VGQAATINNSARREAFLKAFGPRSWHINMSAPTLREFLPDAVTG
jgi:hypothetical protein